MFEQFSCYPEIKWDAAPAAKSLGPGGKIPINPDAENFILVRFRDLRKQPNSKNKIMLIGNNETNIFIEGPDTRLDAIIERLPNYIGKSWVEINKMSLEKEFLNCASAFASVCNPWILKNMDWQSDESKSELNKDETKANEICAECEHFAPKRK